MPFKLPAALEPTYATDTWILRCLSGPHDDTEFVKEEGITRFYESTWQVGIASGRAGVRLEGPPIAWARKSGGEGGSHPSNIHDNGYAFGSVNVTGDTPVILANEGPSMGGYTCLCTVITADLYVFFARHWDIRSRFLW